MAMNIWKKYWDLRTQECPCDVHFVEVGDFKTLRIFRKDA
ncbi:hypothetical protein EMIT0111MI5_20477 [Burkholderia sp. IT-111MI5]